MAITFRGFPFHTDIPPEGQSFESMISASPAEVDGMITQMQAMATEYGLPMGAVRRIYNSRMAQELGHWAVTQDAGDVFHKAAFEAYFADGKNISDTSVLLAIAESAGLPVNEAKLVLDERTLGDPVDRDWDLARELGIVAIPTLMCGEERLVGARPYDSIMKFMATVGVSLGREQ